MPGLVTKNYGTGSYRWLLNTDGIRHTVTGTLDVSSFTAGIHYPNGFFPSGLIVDIADPKAVKPYTGTGKFATLDGDVPVNGAEDVSAAFFVRGQIKTTLLPVTANLPATAPNGFYFTTGA